MFMDNVVMPPLLAAKRERLAAELAAELDDEATCACDGEGGPVYHCSTCAARLINRLQAEIVSLQIIAEEALTAASARSDSRDGARERAERRLGDLFRVAFVGAGLVWRDEHDAEIGAIVDGLVEA